MTKSDYIKLETKYLPQIQNQYSRLGWCTSWQSSETLQLETTG